MFGQGRKPDESEGFIVVTWQAFTLDVHAIIGPSRAESAIPIIILIHGTFRIIIPYPEEQMVDGLPLSTNGENILVVPVEVFERVGLLEPCPVDCIAWEKGEVAVIDREACTECTSCYDACRFMAIE